MSNVRFPLEPLYVFDVQSIAAGHREIRWNGKLWIAQTEHHYSGGILRSKKWLLFAEDMSNYQGLFGSVNAILEHLTVRLEGVTKQDYRKHYEAWAKWRYSRLYSQAYLKFSDWLSLMNARLSLMDSYGSWGDAWLAEPDIVEYLERALS